MFLPVEQQLEILLGGVETTVTVEELRRKLENSRAQKKPLRAKLGCDPTAPDLHLGHSVVLQKLRQFQDLGHTAVLIIGDYTALIGDPTGQNKTRPILSEADIERNAKTYFEQAGKVLDVSPQKLEIRRNSEWLAPMTFADVTRLMAKMTVARMLERDTFEKRYKGGDPISIHEFLYPLMQGQDSVAIRADVELGGTDQLFNNLVGRELQKDAGQESQVVMVMPILEGLDGVEKMSKSKGNYIGLNESPTDMFGKAMSISDELMWKWFALLIGKSAAEITALKKGHPMEAKKALASELVERFHSRAAAEDARRDFETKFSKREVPEDLPEVSIGSGTQLLVDVMLKINAAPSKTEARRLIQQGAVELDGKRVEDINFKLEISNTAVLKVGKKKFYRLIV